MYVESSDRILRWSKKVGFYTSFQVTGTFTIPTML
jgi:hypothetical protein